MAQLKIDLQKCTCKSNEYRSVSNFIHNSIPERDAWEFPLDDKTAVVHLRSSDVINNPWKDYLQPICDYFVRAIEHSQATKVVITAADNTHPCHNIIIKQFSAYWYKEDTQKTFLILARARILKFNIFFFSSHVFTSC